MTSRALPPEAGWWIVAGGLATGCAVALTTGVGAGVPRLMWTLVVAGPVAVVALLNLGRFRAALPILGASATLTGIVLGGAEYRDRVHLERALQQDGQVGIRIEATPATGWTRGRWGDMVTVRVHSAARGGEPVRLPTRCRLEVRARTNTEAQLPAPGSAFRALAELKGPVEFPLLVVASPHLVTGVASPRGAPALRDRLARALLRSAGTGTTRIRGAETAAALALGRRDLIPEARRDGWRRSGLAHVLAVSGLHVGVVAGGLWLVCVACGARPRTVRILLLVAIPAYTVLAGAAPSAVRAATMACLYLAARLLGRSIAPLAALFLAATLLILNEPGLVLEPGFQLTVAVTAALIRWTTGLADSLRGPAWLRNALAVPIVASLAASPIVAIQFQRLAPLGVAVNLAVPIILVITIPAALIATAAAVLAPGFAALLLDLIGGLEALLWGVGALGRAWNPTVATTPVSVIAVGSLAGWLALSRLRLSRPAAVVWLSLLVAVPAVQAARRGPGAERVHLLDVGDGSAVVLSSGRSAVLVDGGRSTQAAHWRLLDQRVGRLAAVIASHGDLDHIGGLERILDRHRVSELAVPDWLASHAEVVGLFRVANRKGTRIVRLTRGAVRRWGDITATCLWPPRRPLPREENDRSLVLRLELPSGAVLTCGDITSTVERRIARTSPVAAEVLVAAHHGSRTSNCRAFLTRVDPQAILIPAGPWNRYGHPDPGVLRLFDDLGIPYCAPALAPGCAAQPTGAGWRTPSGVTR